MRKRTCGLAGLATNGGDTRPVPMDRAAGLAAANLEKSLADDCPDEDLHAQILASRVRSYGAR